MTQAAGKVGGKQPGSGAAPASRSAGGIAARRALLNAARLAFSREGYRASLRQIAIDAGYDHALVYRYFVSKAELFRMAFDHDIRVDELTGERATTGARLMEGLLAREEIAFDLVRAAVKSSGDQEVAAVVADLVETRLTLPLARWLGGPRAVERARTLLALTAGVQLLGEGLRPQDPGERAALSALLARTFQGLVDEPLDDADHLTP